MLIDLARATPQTSGGKAAPLARLLRAGLPVPPGFVLPIRAYEEAIAALSDDADSTGPLAKQPILSSAVVDEVVEELRRITGASGRFVVVRSSATSEDAQGSAGAGQHDTFLAVRGADEVADAVRTCWASLWSSRAVEYRTRRRRHLPAGRPAMAVLVQPMVDADVAGVMFTGTTTQIEASWGLGEPLVSGQVTPDSWMVADRAVVSMNVGEKATRADRVGAKVVARSVRPTDRHRPCLADEDVLHLARIGQEIEDLLGSPQDVEWAITGDHIWLLQARPVTTALPSPGAAARGALREGTFLAGTPGSSGLAAGPARLVRGPADLTTVRPGDILVCRTTDAAWTPLFGVVAAVVTETGGLLSHAAIVARELGLPAVLAVPHAMAEIPQGAIVEVDGSNGWVAWKC